MAGSFTEFKTGFYGRVNDLKLFDCGKYNLLKVVLDGLRVGYSSKGKIRIFLFLPVPFIRFYFFLIGLKNRSSVFTLPLIPDRKNWIIDAGGRVLMNNGKATSLYFENIATALGRENVCIVVEGGKDRLAAHDIRLKTYNAGLIAGLGKFDKAEKLLIADLKDTFSKIKASSIFSVEELRDIKVAFQQFFIQYRIWKHLLSESPPSVVYLITHYHREGVILALKERNVKVIELQHGIISPKDIFYVFPEKVAAVENRALFADEIWVYGQFWKDQLLLGSGYPESRIRTIGYYLSAVNPEKEAAKKVKDIFPGKKLVLVTTQTTMHQEFCSYISLLSADILKHDLPYAILVKLHPSEKRKDYSVLDDLSNVAIIDQPIELLFTLADLQISIYSTTLFEGLRFGLKNYSIAHEAFEDYIKWVEENGVSTVIQKDENPILELREEKKYPQHSVEYFFESFQKQML